MSTFSQKREKEYRDLAGRIELKPTDTLALAGAAGGVGVLMLGAEIGSILLPVIGVGIVAIATAIKLFSRTRSTSRHQEKYEEELVGANRRGGRDRRHMAV